MNKLLLAKLIHKFMGPDRMHPQVLREVGDCKATLNNL